MPYHHSPNDATFLTWGRSSQPLSLGSGVSQLGAKHINTMNTRCGNHFLL
jgi:hypothetical protein